MAYDVQLRHNVVSLNPDWKQDRFLEARYVHLSPLQRWLMAYEILSDLEVPATVGVDSVIGGFQYAGSYLFASSAYLDFHGAISATRLEGALANQMVTNTSDPWFIQFRDPMDTMIGAMREIAFCASLM